MDPSEVNKPAVPTPATGSSTAPANTSPPKYVPQFSAATEMILKRINSGASASGLTSFGVTPMGTLPSGYEDMRRSVMMGMKTSMNMEIPTTPVNKGGRRNQGSRASVGSAASASVSKAGTPGTSTAQKNGTPSSAGKGRKPRAKAGQKRKRARRETSDEESEEEDSDVMSKLGGDSDSDASDSIQNFPKVTQSGRAIVKPQQFVPEIRETSARKRGPSKKSQEMALCKRCGRGHSPDNNMIVFCDGCNGGWHQMCHDPPVSNEAVKDEDAPWFCLDCSQKRARKSAPKGPAVDANISVLNSNELTSNEPTSNDLSPSFSPNAPFTNSYANASYTNTPYSNTAFTTNGPYASNIAFPNNNGYSAEAALSMPTASPSPRLISWEGRSSEDVSFPRTYPIYSNT